MADRLLSCASRAPLGLSLLFLAGCAMSPGGQTDAQTMDGAAAHLTTCDPLMWIFPVGDAHNIGYDNASCGSGTCEISCPDEHANSDWGGDHHGIDVFAYQRAPLVAVVEGEIVASSTPSDTSGLRVRLRDACGWEYYYGHMDESVVSVGQWVEAGELIGYMGYTGTSSTHLHFNVSPDGEYYDDINPFDLLYWTSGSACDGDSWTDPGEEEEHDDDGGSESGTDGGGETDPGDGGGESSDSGGDSGGESGGETGETGTCGIVGGTTYFSADDSLTSCDGRFTLYMQSDGNLVLYQVGVTALWSTQTHGNAGAWAALQDDGNLVVYSAGGSALWATGSSGHPGATLHVQGDGNLVIYDGSTAVWDSQTCCH